MKAKLVIDIDACEGGIEQVESILERALDGVKWSMLNAGSSNRISRVWAESTAGGCDIAASMDAGSGWDAALVTTTRQDIEKAVQFVMKA